MTYTVNPFIPTKWKALPRRNPEVKPAYYRHWVDASSDYFIHITAEQREAPDQYIGNCPPTAMLGLMEARALKHLLDDFIVRAEARQAQEPHDAFSEVFNVHEGQTIEALISNATANHARHMQREHPNEYRGRLAADEEMHARARHAEAIAERSRKATATQLIDGQGEP